MQYPGFPTSVRRVLVSALMTAFCAAVWAQSPPSGLGRTPTEEEIRAWEAETAMAVSARDATIKGRLVDQRCYAEDKSNTGVAHKGMSRTCAVECVKKGEGVALLTSDGRVYEISGPLAADNNAKLVAHLGHTVEVTGHTMDHGRGRLMINGTTLKMIAK